MDGTIIQQGRFTSDGTSELISLRSGVDWMEVINFTQMGTTQTPGRGVKFEWQRGFATGAAVEFFKEDATSVLEGTTISSGGFIQLDTSGEFGPEVTGTTITKASPPVCTATAHGFVDGDTVVFSKLTNMPQIATIFFDIDNVTANTFELKYFDTNTANFTTETGFTVRRVPLEFGSVNWTNAFATLIDITVGATTQVQTATDFEDLQYEVGAVLRFAVPPEFGTVQLDGVAGTVTAYNSSTNTYTLDIDSSTFTSFAWPASSAVPMRFPNLVKVGNENTSPINPTTNTDDLLIKLEAGINSPAGSSGDVIYWKAGKSFSVTNE